MWGKIDNFFREAFQLINLKNKTKNKRNRKASLAPIIIIATGNFH